MEINAKGLSFQELNNVIRNNDDVTFTNVNGQRYIASGASNKTINLYGVAGNATASYLNGATINIYGNAQDALCDTMNNGLVIVHGNIGDTACYASKGGKLFVKGNAGYRLGVHIKEYKDKKPVIIIGGTCGSFLGEYQAGGVIIIINKDNKESPVGLNVANGMHNGVIYIRKPVNDIDFASHVIIEEVDPSIDNKLREYLEEYNHYFDIKEAFNFSYLKVTTSSTNPFGSMYKK